MLEDKEESQDSPKDSLVGYGCVRTHDAHTSSQASPQHPENRGRRHPPSRLDMPLIRGEEDDGPYISKEQMTRTNSLCRNERADVGHGALQLWVRRTRPWDLEPCPKEEWRETVTTKQHFRMITQPVGTGHRAENATRRNPAQCSRGWAGAVSKVE